MKQTAAIFGAGGKLGRHLLGVLDRRGMNARALVHRTPVQHENVTSISGSITDAAAVEETVRGADIVVQLATTKEDADTFFDVSVRGTFNILEACRRQGVKQFILLGGDAALGIWFYPQPIPIDENHPLMAYPGYYAFSKVMEETMAQQYAVQYGVPVTVLRSSWVFEQDDLLNHFSLLKNVNPAEPGHGFGKVSDEVLALVRAGKEHIPVLTGADGTPLRRHIVHVDDVMQSFDRMLGNPSAIGQTFNDSGQSIEDIFSGSIVVDENNSSGLAKNGETPLIALYTSAYTDKNPEHAGKQAQSLAYSLDEGGAAPVRLARQPVRLGGARRAQ